MNIISKILKDQQTEKQEKEICKAKRKIRNTSLQNRKLEHRKNHPNDRLSFGEKYQKLETKLI